MRQFTRTRKLEAELESVAPRIRPSDLPRFRPFQQAQVPSTAPSATPSAAAIPPVPGS